jgi:hypothetical protein
MVWRSVDSVWSLLAQLSTVTHRRSWRWQSTLQRSSSRGGQQTSQAATTSSTNLWRRPNAVRSLSTLPNRSHSVLVRTDADRKSCRCSCQTMRVQSKCSPCTLNFENAEAVHRDRAAPQSATACRSRRTRPKCPASSRELARQCCCQIVASPRGRGRRQLKD